MSTVRIRSGDLSDIATARGRQHHGRDRDKAQTVADSFKASGMPKTEPWALHSEVYLRTGEAKADSGGGLVRSDRHASREPSCRLGQDIADSPCSERFEGRAARVGLRRSVSVASVESPAMWIRSNHTACREAAASLG